MWCVKWYFEIVSIIFLLISVCVSLGVWMWVGVCVSLSVCVCVCVNACTFLFLGGQCPQKSTLIAAVYCTTNNLTQCKDSSIIKTSNWSIFQQFMFQSIASICKLFIILAATHSWQVEGLRKREIYCSGQQNSEWGTALWLEVAPLEGFQQWF